MNAVFLKEVSDSVLKGNLAKLKYVNIGNDEYVIEINVSNKIINCINKNYVSSKTSVITQQKKISWVNKLNIKYDLFKFRKCIAKIINKNSLIGYSIIYSNELKKNRFIKEYLENIFNLFSINEYVNTDLVEDNLYKYIEEYNNKSNIKKENINILAIINDIDNLNFDLIDSLNQKYKDINIYTATRPNNRVLNKIKKINEEYGSCIGFIDRLKKDFRKYNIYIFIDKGRSEYIKYKFNKKACFIDLTNKENDRFNEKYIKLEKNVKSNKYNAEKIKEFYELYGKITVSNVIIDD